MAVIIYIVYINRNSLFMPTAVPSNQSSSENTNTNTNGSVDAVNTFNNILNNAWSHL